MRDPDASISGGIVGSRVCPVIENTVESDQLVRVRVPPPNPISQLLLSAASMFLPTEKASGGWSKLPPRLQVSTKI